MTNPPCCPVCRGAGLRVFFEAPGVPVQSVMLVPTREAARAFPRGDIRLAACPSCGFITNIDFREEAVRYAPGYEATQACSSIFTAFHRELAADLARRHRLQQKQVVEIGCGRGEFLQLLLDAGAGRGVGFDPAGPARGRLENPTDRLVVIPHPFPGRRHRLEAALVCCKMTLEHIPRPAEFLGDIFRALAGGPDTVYFIQVPNADRILRGAAFWDIYYEHCSYFGQTSLTRLLHQLDGEVLDLRTAYDDQYLLAETRPGRPGWTSASSAPADPAWAETLSRFARTAQDKINRWRTLIRDDAAKGRRTVLWGSGSKAVSFLNLLNLADEIAGAVDINPKRQGTFIAGTGHEILAPESLVRRPPDVVVAMNPIYREEIRAQLSSLGLQPEIRELN